MDKSNYEKVDNRRYSVAEATQSHDLDTMYSKEAKEIRFKKMQMAGRNNKIESSKVLLPYRRKPKDGKGSPMDTKGIFPTLFYTWLTPLFQKSYSRQPLQENDFQWMMSSREGADISSERLIRLWQEELVRKGETDSSLGRTLIRFVRTRLIFSMLTSLLSLGSNYLIGAYVLYSLVNYLASGPVDSIQYGMWLAVALFLSTAFRAIGANFSWYLSVRTACRIRASVLMTIYKKLMNVQNIADASVGEVVNIYVNDGQRLFETCMVSGIFAAAPIFMIIVLIAAVVVIGPAAFVGVISMLLIFVSQISLSRVIGKIRSRTVSVSDRRVRLMGELLANINLIKKYAWEETFSKTIAGVRSREQSFLQKAGYMQSFSIAMATFIAPAAAMTTIVTQVLAGGTVTAAQAYALMSLFYGIGVVIYIIPMALKPLSETSIALRRMKVILLMKETSFKCKAPEDTNNAIEVVSGSFAWNSEKPEEQGFSASREDLLEQNSKERVEGEKLLEQNGTPKQVIMLKNIDLAVPKGELVGICGAVGSGKSSLLYAILDQMETVSGSVAIAGSMALVSQQAWIQNATVRENILFTKSFDQEKYDHVVETCCLKPDFEIMTSGDLTEIGERGINLSGGQKQRISIARALYADRDIYMLDDPLSAVDTHVGSHIFNKCIKGALKGKTVLFVTHQLQYLEECDSIILMKNGQIEEQGTHEELMKSNGEYAKLINTFVNKEEDENKNEVDKKSIIRKATVKKKLGKLDFDETDGEGDGKLVEDETTGGSVVQMATYKQYMHYMGGVFMALLMTVLAGITVLSLVTTNACVAIWLRTADLIGNNTISNGTDPTQESSVLGLGDDLKYFVLVYVSAFLIALLFLLLMCYVFVRILLRAATRLHNALFQRIIRCPMSFFDTTPLGRILNRFSKDLDEVDIMLPSCIQKFALFFFAVFISLTVVGVLIPWYYLVLAIVFPLIFMYTLFFRRGFCEMKHLDSQSLSKLVGHLTATMQGLVTIRTFRKTDHFCRSFGNVLNKNTLIMELFYTAYRWVHVRLDMISAFSTGATAVLVVLLRDSVSPAFAGFILFTGINMCSGMVQSMVSFAMDAESCFVAVERMIEYLKTLKPEAPEIIEGNRPAPDWPSEGKVEFEGVQMRYRPNLPMILKGITLKITSKERIGIVGRTGSGKSTLGVVLFRIVELSGGKIVIDGIDISTIGLKDLRSKLSIIPQDPVLFLGTVRYNLDPLNIYTDEQLWSALEQSHIKEKISQLEGKLHAPVVENGENFSVGERQLICMARAILRNSKVLILDEATAAIDTKTDSLIQRTIREAFKGCTMLIIAHRLNTVLDCDRILVMDNGMIGEFDKPDVLLSDEESMLSKMVAAGK